MPAGRAFAISDLPDQVVRVLATLTDAGHEAALVGGSVRDRLLKITHDGDWDAASSAHPEQVAALFPGSAWQNRFGTVTVGRDPAVEITSYRAEAAYTDRRRPDEVRFGVSLAEDLARRDFTINAIAWVPSDPAAGAGHLHDPFGGERDLEDRVLRAVGDARERFAEDALRLIRAVRFAGRFVMTIEPDTEEAIRDLAPTAASVSQERIRDELLRILRLDPRPSGALRMLEGIGLMAMILPEVSALRGVPQSKAVPGDAFDHSLATVDAVPAGGEPDLRLTALLHDLGKATTLSDGHFIGHETVGAEMAANVLHRLRMPRWRAERVVGVIGQHMYEYDSDWTDAAVRRFIRRTADVDRQLLFALRRADNAASGVGRAGDANQAELEARIEREVEGHRQLLVGRRLAIDGHDLQRELGIAPGPRIGEILDRLTELVLEDPSRNDRAILLKLAQDR